MSPVVTNEFQLSRSEYVGILARNLFRRRAILMLILAGAGAWCWMTFGLGLSTLYFAVCLALYPVFLFGWIWRHATASDNRRVYQRRRVTFDDEFIFVCMDDGSESKLRWNHITRVERTRDHFLLYLSRTQWIILPVRAFAGDDDVADMVALLRSMHHLAT